MPLHDAMDVVRVATLERLAHGDGQGVGDPLSLLPDLPLVHLPLSPQGHGRKEDQYDCV